MHIVGVPSTGFQSKKALLHHTLGDGRYDAYINVYKQLTIAQANLNKGNFRAGSSEASEEIDRVIKTALTRCFPTYLTLPTDLATGKTQYYSALFTFADALSFALPAEISEEPLKTPITLESIHKSLHEPKVAADVEKSIIKQVCQMYEKASKPIVLVDACAIRYGVQDYTRDLIEKTGMVRITPCLSVTPCADEAIRRPSSPHPWAKQPLMSNILNLAASTLASSRNLMFGKPSKAQTSPCMSVR